MERLICGGWGGGTEFETRSNNITAVIQRRDDGASSEGCGEELDLGYI